MRNQQSRLEPQTEYEFWDLTMPVIPERTRLFPLKPEGVGTPLVEGITSYIARLAEEHSVQTGRLFASELATLLADPGHAQVELMGRPYKYSQSSTWLGTQSSARGLTNVLEKLTSIPDLHSLTMVRWGDALTGWHLVRKTRAWCPHCLREWKQEDRRIYEPLLWSLAPVSVCPLHESPLETICPNPLCNGPVSLPQLARLGHCSRCGDWLGKEQGPLLLASNEERTPEMAYEVSLAKCVGALIASPRQGCEPLCSPVFLSDFIRGQLWPDTPHTVKSLAPKLGIQYSVLLSAATGEAKIQLSTLARLSHAWGIPILQLITEIPATDIGNIQSIPVTATHGVVRKRASRLSHKRIVAELKRAASCDLQSAESLNKIGRRLGIAYQTLAAYYPELCNRIKDRYRARCQANWNAQLQLVRQTTIELHLAGIVPTQQQVENRAKVTRAWLDPRVRKMLADTRLELGYTAAQ
jgi:hypothetical protein